MSKKKPLWPTLPILIKLMPLRAKGNKQRDQNTERPLPPTTVYHLGVMKKCLTTAKAQSNTYVEHTEIWELIK